jgi:omega-amidase
MNISLIQAPLFWENPIANRNYFEQKINGLNFKTDLVILPEMFTSGFTMHPKSVAENLHGETIQWLQSLASKNQLAITGSLVIEEKGNYYNRMVFVFPNGDITSYDKRHLFTLAGENLVYNPGKSKTIVTYKDWKICLQICYDLRFPVFVRNVESYDLLIYVANWPKPRINAWNILLKARAVENLCYVVGVNRIGEDSNQHLYVGHSQVIDELGNFIVEPSENEEIFTALLDKNKMLETRSKLNFLNDQDAFKLL